MKLDPPKRWNNLPAQHRDVLMAMIRMLNELKRWPMIPELAERLERSKSSIKNSLMWLSDRRMISVTRFGKAMPPAYEISGVEITFEVNMYGDNLDLGGEETVQSPLDKRKAEKAKAAANGR